MCIVCKNIDMRTKYPILRFSEIKGMWILIMKDLYGLRISNLSTGYLGALCH